MLGYEVTWWSGGAVRQQRVQARDASGIAAALGCAPQQVLSVQPERRSQPAYQVRRRAARLDLRLFCVDLALLLEAGVPLLEALTALHERERKPAAREALGLLVHRVRDGDSLAQAFAADAETFGTILPPVTAASERAGRLAQVLQEQADYLAWTEQLRTRLVTAMVYPALLLSVGLLVLGFLVVVVMPRFAGLLEGSDVELPWASRALMALGQGVAEHPAAALMLLVGFVAVGLLAAASPALRVALAQWAWRWPGVGERLRMVAFARLYRTLGMLTSAGVPVFQSLEIALPSLPRVLRPALQRVQGLVWQGLPLSEALAEQQLVDGVTRRMLDVGERAGQLPAMLGRAAGFLDEQLLRLAEYVARVVNPVLMLAMGVVVGGLVVLMYLPIFQLVETVR